MLRTLGILAGRPVTVRLQQSSSGLLIVLTSRWFDEYPRHCCFDAVGSVDGDGCFERLAFAVASEIDRVEIALKAMFERAYPPGDLVFFDPRAALRWAEVGEVGDVVVHAISPLQ